MIKAILMDMDGLMLDTERLAVRAWIEAGALHGFELTEGDIINNIGRGAHETKEYLRSRYPGAPVEDMYNDRLRIAQEVIACEPPAHMPGLIEFLEDADEKGYRKCVATSTMPERARFTLERAGLLSRFEGFSCGGPGVPSKPEPDIFLNAARILGYEPRNCVVVEDSPHGMLAGLNAGMRVIGVPDLVPVPERIKDRVIICRDLFEARGWI